MPTLLDHPKPETRNPKLSHHAEGISEDAGEASLAASAAMLPADLLQPGEVIILLLKPSPWFIVLGAMKMLIGIALVTGLVLAVQSIAPIGLGRREIVALGFLAGGVRLFWQFLEWLCRVYVLTDQRVIRVMGVLRISIFETPLQQVQNTEVFISIRERLLGLGTIAFATAGTGAYEAFWVMIERPMEVHQKVVQTLRRYRR